MEIVIKKAGIISSLFLSYEFEQTDSNAKNIIKTSSDLPIHEDLRKAFRALIPHFVFICEEITDETIIENAINNYDAYLENKETSLYPELFKYYVSDFTLSGKGDAVKLKISGSKLLENFGNISWAAPDILLDSTKYVFVEKLKIAIEVLKHEVIAYMEGKHAPKAQLEMFEGDEEDEAKYETPAIFKKTAKKSKSKETTEEEF